MQCMMRTWCMHELYVLTNLRKIKKILAYSSVAYTRSLNNDTSRSIGNIVSVPVENCILAQQFLIYHSMKVVNLHTSHTPLCIRRWPHPIIVLMTASSPKGRKHPTCRYLCMNMRATCKYSSTI
jgi:hypothetical protein